MDLSKKILFEISVAWLIEIAVNKTVEFSSLLQMEIAQFLIDSGYGEDLKKAKADRINELRGNLETVIGKAGMDKLNTAISETTEAIKKAAK